MLRSDNRKLLSVNNFHFLPGETGVYLNTILRNLGTNLVSFFIPVYIYQLTGKLESAFLYYAFYHLFVLLSVLIAGWLTTKIGIDWAEFIGSFFRALFIYFLLLADNHLFFLFLSSLFYGLTVPFCWLPYHYTVVGAENEDGLFGKETSRIKIWEQITGSIGPFIGGLIIVSLGFDWLYRIAIILVLLSGLPLFFDKFNKKGMRFNVGKIVTSFWHTGNRRYALAFCGQGFKDVILIIAWPLFMFLVVKRYETLGAIQTIALLVTLLLLWRLGERIDKGKVGFFKWGVLINSLSWLIRAFLLTPLSIFFSNIIYGFGSLLVWTPFDALMYKSMLKKRRLEFLILRETAIHGSGLLGCFLIWQFIKWQISWFGIFSIGAVGLLMVFSVSRGGKKNG